MIANTVYVRSQTPLSASHQTSRVSAHSQMSYESIKNNQQTWLLNRRKQTLRKTSLENLAIYKRINSQKQQIFIESLKKSDKKKKSMTSRFRSNKENINIDVMNLLLRKTAKEVLNEIKIGD